MARRLIAEGTDDERNVIICDACGVEYPVDTPDEIPEGWRTDSLYQYGPCHADRVPIDTSTADVVETVEIGPGDVGRLEL